MSISLPNSTALIVIDMQKGFDDPFWGKRNNPNAESNIEKILAHWRAKQRPVYIVQHLSRMPNLPLSKGVPGSALKDFVKPISGEKLITKQVNSAFIGTNLEESLRQREINSLVFVGLTTNHCVSTTARMANNLGFNTFVVGDATAAFDKVGPDGKNYSAEVIHQLSLVNLHDEFATIAETAAIIESRQ